MDEDNGLYLVIDDDYKTVDFFDVTCDYTEYHSDDRLNTVRVYVKEAEHAETVAYLECTIFYDEIISESNEDHVMIADSEMADDSYQAMIILSEQKLLNRDDSNILVLLAQKPLVTVYLNHIAVRENYRGNGIGNWLVRNLPSIIRKNYKVNPGVVIVKLFPEMVDWEDSQPRFDDCLADTKEFDEMFVKMKRLFEANEYAQHDQTNYFIRDYIEHPYFSE